MVRPGRFMSTLHAMKAELQSGQGTAADLPALLSRLGAIHLEAVAVLDSIQRGEARPPVRGGT